MLVLINIQCSLGLSGRILGGEAEKADGRIGKNKMMGNREEDGVQNRRGE